MICTQSNVQSIFLYFFFLAAVPDPRPPFFPDAGSAAPPLPLPAEAFCVFLVPELPAPFKSTWTWIPKKQPTTFYSLDI